MRDEQIAFQQQELEKQALKRTKLSKMENLTRKRVSKDNKGYYIDYLLSIVGLGNITVYPIIDIYSQ